ncbi:amidohydrolase family protein [Chloroflexota bacterium]
MKIIAVEEHFTTEEYIAYLHTRTEVPRREYIQDENGHQIERVEWERGQFTIVNPEYSKRLSNLGEGRLKEMDEGGVDVQVLSLNFPGTEQFSAADGTAIARSTNDRLADAVRQHPERFAGLAALAPQDPEAAAAELERAVRVLGFKGASINSHVQGEYLDDKKYWVIFETAEKLGVPIYIHPRVPSPDMVKPYLAYPGLSQAMLGFGAEVSLHAMRLMCGGVFDKYPRLKIILGHMGEALPFWMWRIDNKWQSGPMGKRRERLPSQYLKDNFYVTTSGMFWPPVLQFVNEVLGADRIMFATDFPHESTPQAVSFIKEASIGDADREKITHRNAEQILGL